MKRWCIGLLAALLLCGLAACGGKDADNTAPGGNAADTKLGLGCVATRMMEADDTTRVKITAAAVALDKDGKIQNCRVEETEYTVSADGKPLNAAALVAKGEQGDAYTLTKEDTGGASELKTSWEQQARAFATFVRGKTAGEVSGIAATDGKSAEIEGCDLVITDFIEAVRKAADGAKSAAVATGDELRLAMTTTKNGESTDAAPQLDTELAAVAVNGGKITACITDTLQAKLTVEDGKFTTVSGAIETKRMLGDGYGMKGASSIKKEWYEQADAFDRWCVGKTADQLGGLKPDASGKVDGISGCTIGVSGMLHNVMKAVKE